MCILSGDEYLKAKRIDPEDMWDNIIALAVMSPCYLFVAYLILLRCVKQGVSVHARKCLNLPA